jgi:hypothetical protein
MPPEQSVPWNFQHKQDVLLVFSIGVLLDKLMFRFIQVGNGYR